MYAHCCSEWCIVGYGTGTLWDLWDWFLSIYRQNIKKIQRDGYVNLWVSFFFLICSQKREKMGIYQMRTQNSWIKPTVILRSSKVTMLAPMCLVWAPTPHSHTALTPTNQDADAAMTSSASHVMTFRHWACWVSGRNHLIWSVFFRYIFRKKNFSYWLKYQWSLFIRVR